MRIALGIILFILAVVPPVIRLWRVIDELSEHEATLFEALAILWVLGIMMWGTIIIVTLLYVGLLRIE